MKKCPKCNRAYDDSWAICLYDRTQLMLFTTEDKKKITMSKLENEHNNKNSENDTTIGFYLLLVLMILWIVIFLAIANSDLYYAPRVEAGPLLLYIAYFITLFPIFMLNCGIGASMIVMAVKQKRYKLAMIAAFISMCIITINIFSSSIYDKYMTAKIGLLDTKTLITSKNKKIKYFSSQIINKRKDELLQSLKKNYDSLSSDEIGRYLVYLRKNPDPIIDKCAMGLFKELLSNTRGWPYYATSYLELLIRRSYPNVEPVKKELYEFAGKVIDDNAKLATFKKEFELLVEKYAKNKDYSGWY